MCVGERLWELENDDTALAAQRQNSVELKVHASQFERAFSRSLFLREEGALELYPRRLAASWNAREPLLRGGGSQWPSSGDSREVFEGFRGAAVALEMP